MIRGPRVPSRAELGRVGVTIEHSEDPFTLKCGACGTTWDVAPPQSGTKLQVDYRKCPNGCNKRGATT